MMLTDLPKSKDGSLGLSKYSFSVYMICPIKDIWNVMIVELLVTVVIQLFFNIFVFEETSLK